MAMTSKMCIKYPVLIPGTIPNIPKSQTTMQMTAANHNKLLMTLHFKVICLNISIFCAFVGYKYFLWYIFMGI